MKKQVLILVMIMCAGMMTITAQYNSSYKPSPQMSSTYIKDNGYGARVNFGVTYAPTISWMYEHTAGYAKDGVIMGMRYGANLNINLTQRKSFYFSTGLFAEHCGGKMQFYDNVPVGNFGVADSILTHRTYRSIYLTIPTMITLKTYSINNFFVCGNLGLMHSFNLNATNTDSYLFGEELWSRERKPSDEAALFKEAFIVGVGFEYSITSNMRAGLMLNYVQTITNYFKGRGRAQNSLSKLDQRANMGCVEIALNINFF